MSALLPTTLSVFIQSLSDPRRLRLMMLLSQEPRSAAALADASGLSAGEIDKALRRLQETGLVVASDDAYTPNQTVLRVVADELGAIIPAETIPRDTPLAFETVLSALQTLNRPQALALLIALGQRDGNAESLAQTTGLALPIVEDTLARLNALGLAEVSGAAGSYVYHLHAVWLRTLPLALDRVPPPAAPASVASPVAEDFEQKTLRDFLVDGRLKTIPSQEKKREVILRYLVELFEPQRQYPEREVNAILRDVHPDAASLRRHLVDSHLMQRDHGIYWRTQP
ncbi:MAG: DUF2087 domain-containing protein [Anaerolineae bacterium]